MKEENFILRVGDSLTLPPPSASPEDPDGNPISRNPPCPAAGSVWMPIGVEGRELNVNSRPPGDEPASSSLCSSPVLVASAVAAAAPCHRQHTPVPVHNCIREVSNQPPHGVLVELLKVSAGGEQR